MGAAAAAELSEAPGDASRSKKLMELCGVLKVLRRKKTPLAEAAPVGRAAVSDHCQQHREGRHRLVISAHGGTAAQAQGPGSWVAGEMGPGPLAPPVSCTD